MQPDKTRKQILIVEDEGLIAADIQQRLERLGYYAPVIVGSGEDAIQSARSTPFDLVLMDIRLKGEMDGIDAASILKTELRLPVVYLTAHSDMDTVDRAKITEPLGYVLKPVNDGDLRSVVHIALYKHEMERRLRTSEAWLSATLRSVGEGIIATDTTGLIIFMNPVAEAVTGWSAEAAFARPLMEVLRLFDGTRSQPSRNPVFDLFDRETRSYRLVTNAGSEKIVEIECYENQSDKILFGSIIVVRDISGRREIEEQFAVSQRMEAVANLAGRLGQDLNHHLMTILHCAGDLFSRLEGEDKQRMHAISQAAGEMASITGHLLTLGRFDTSGSEVLEINDLLRDLKRSVERVLAPNQTFSFDVSVDDAFIRADREQIKQALVSLSMSGREAIPKRGGIRLESSILEVEAGSQPARRYRPGVYARIRMSDSGPAIDKTTLAHVFEPYSGRSSAACGGFALSTTYSIVARCGGYVTASSEASGGATFELLLPAIAVGRCPKKRTRIHRRAVILLIEEEQALRSAMQTALAESGYEILEVRTLPDAQAIVGAYRDPINLLVTDADIPGISGAELAERLIGLYPELKVLFITGYRHDDLQRPAYSLNAAELAKPFPPSELLRAVDLLLNAPDPSPVQ